MKKLATPVHNQGLGSWIFCVLCFFYVWWCSLAIRVLTSSLSTHVPMVSGHCTMAAQCSLLSTIQCTLSSDVLQMFPQQGSALPTSFWWGGQSHKTSSSLYFLCNSHHLCVLCTWSFCVQVSARSSSNICIETIGFILMHTSVKCFDSYIV